MLIFLFSSLFVTAKAGTAAHESTSTAASMNDIILPFVFIPNPFSDPIPGSHAAPASGQMIADQVSKNLLIEMMLPHEPMLIPSARKIQSRFSAMNFTGTIGTERTSVMPLLRRSAAFQ